MNATAVAESAPPVGRLQRLSVTQWFGLVAGALLLVAALSLFAGLVALSRLSDRRELLADRLDPAATAALRLSGALLNEETGIRGYALAADRKFLAPYTRGRAEETTAVRDLVRLQTAAELGRLRADLASVSRSAIAWRRGYAEPAMAAVSAGADPPPAATGKQRFDAVRSAVAAQQRDLGVLREAARADLDRTATNVWVLFVGSGLLVLLAMLAAAFTLRRVIIRPIERLAGAVRTVARGDFDRPLQPSGPREVVALGVDVDVMRRRIVAEVTALRHAETALLEQARELQRSNEELEQFAYVASHDLQEPLRKVASFTQMLERRYKGQLDERADRYIGFAVDGAKRMQDLINDLLEFSRVGRATRAQERVDCNLVVAQARVRLDTMIAESGAEVSAGDLPTVNGDAGLLTAAFQNLIANAVKFHGDAPPRVRIEAERDGRFWRFSCTDNGIGVEDEYAERIFVIFQRLHTREAYDGTGIGLAMVRKIVDFHGGRIQLAPAEAGRGARFIFTLPADEPQEETSP